MLKTKQDQANFHRAMADILDNGLNLVHAYNKRNPFGGFTIIWSEVFPKSKMIEVAVSYCDQKDQYVQDIGTLQAYTKFVNGEIIQLPLGKLSTEEQANVLFRMFAL